MFLLWLLTCTLLSFAQSGPGKKDNQVGLKLIGTPAPLNRFQYVCSIRERGTRRLKCGGSLVHPRWVLTAAHCVDDGPRSTGPDPIVYCGTHGITTNDPDHIFNAEEYIHEKWNGNYEDGFDIALLKLDRETDLPIPAYDRRGNGLRDGLILTALGWGVTETGFPAKTLQMAERLHYASPKKCKKFLGDIVRNKNVICAGFHDQDTCQGDSGGPLLDPDRPDGNLTAGLDPLDFVVGVLSFGDKKCTAEVPGVYTAVHAHWKWIQDTIGGDTVKEDTVDEDKDASTVKSQSSTEMDQPKTLSPPLSIEDPEIDDGFPLESPAMGPADIALIDRLEGFSKGDVEPQGSSLPPSKPVSRHNPSKPIAVRQSKAGRRNGRYPYLCSIGKSEMEDRHVCDGVLLYDRWVITAAHCVDSEMEESTGPNPVVFCGIVDFNDPGTASTFRGSAVLHPRWNGSIDNGFDIAMIRLNKRTPSWSPVDAFISSDVFWDRMDVVSWGLAEYDGDKWKIRPIGIRLLNHDACLDVYPGYKTETMFCAMMPSYATSCQVTSGSPALISAGKGVGYGEGSYEEAKVTGILSRVPVGCDASVPVVYTNISYYRNWILKTKETA